MYQTPGSASSIASPRCSAGRCPRPPPDRSSRRLWRARPHRKQPRRRAPAPGDGWRGHGLVLRARFVVLPGEATITRGHHPTQLDPNMDGERVGGVQGEMTMESTRASTMPGPTDSHESPPSRLREMPRSKVPAKIRRGSWGSTATHITPFTMCPLARLLFVPQHDGRLHQCAINAFEAGLHHHRWRPRGRRGTWQYSFGRTHGRQHTGRRRGRGLSQQVGTGATGNGRSAFACRDAGMRSTRER